jgi:hypothetical protein
MENEDANPYCSNGRGCRLHRHAGVPSRMALEVGDLAPVGATRRSCVKIMLDFVLCLF